METIILFPLFVCSFGIIAFSWILRSELFHFHILILIAVFCWGFFEEHQRKFVQMHIIYKTIITQMHYPTYLVLFH